CCAVDGLGTVASPRELSALPLHDALPIWRGALGAPPGLEGQQHAREGVGDRERRGDAEDVRDARRHGGRGDGPQRGEGVRPADRDRKSTRLNSSHVKISYAVFCLKKKKRT